MGSSYFADILGLGTTELIVILVIVLLLFGGKQLPKLSKSLGDSVKELRKGFGDESPTKNNTAHAQNREENRS